MTNPTPPDFGGTFEARFVDDEDYRRTGRAWLEIINDKGRLTVPVSQESRDIMETTRAYRDQAREAAKDAADGITSQVRDQVAGLVEAGLPDASATVKGRVRLAGDLAGTADAPTVPGLAGKVNTSEVGISATPGSIVRRRDDGQIILPTANPATGNDAVNRRYVDNRINTRAAVSHSHISSHISDAVSVINGTANRVVKTSSDGLVRQSSVPTIPEHVVNKAYVDGAITAAAAPAGLTGSLNDVKASGWYYQTSPSAATTANGYPATYAGVLQVIQLHSNWVIQNYYRYNHSDWYMREWNGTSWTAWRRNIGVPGIGDVAGLQGALESKASASHTHTSSDISNTTAWVGGGYGNRVLSTDSSGMVNVASDPSQVTHVARKGYVDSAIQAAMAVSEHTQQYITIRKVGRMCFLSVKGLPARLGQTIPAAYRPVANVDFMVTDLNKREGIAFVTVSTDGIVNGNTPTAAGAASLWGDVAYISAS